MGVKVEGWRGWHQLDAFTQAAWIHFVNVPEDYQKNHGNTSGMLRHPYGFVTAKAAFSPGPAGQLLCRRTRLRSDGEPLKLAPGKRHGHEPDDHGRIASIAEVGTKPGGCRRRQPEAMARGSPTRDLNPHNPQSRAIANPSLHWMEGRELAGS